MCCIHITRLTYVNKGLLDVSERQHWQLCVVLVPEPGVNGLQGSVCAAPPSVITFVLHCTHACLKMVVADRQTNSHLLADIFEAVMTYIAGQKCVLTDAWCNIRGMIALFRHLHCRTRRIPNSGVCHSPVVCKPGLDHRYEPSLLNALLHWQPLSKHGIW